MLHVWIIYRIRWKMAIFKGKWLGKYSPHRASGNLIEQSMEKTCPTLSRGISRGKNSSIRIQVMLNMDFDQQIATISEWIWRDLVACHLYSKFFRIVPLFARNKTCPVVKIAAVYSFWGDIMGCPNKNQNCLENELSESRYFACPIVIYRTPW